MLLLTTYEAMVVYLPFMLVQGSLAKMLPAWAEVPWFILIIYYSATRLSVIFEDYLTTWWSADEAGVVIRSGWLLREETTLTWNEVGTVKTSQSWLARLLGVVEVTITVGASERSSLVIAAVTLHQAQEIRSLHEASGLHSVAAKVVADECVAFEGQDAEELIYQASFRDYLLIGFTHGQFLLLIPFLFGSGADIFEFLGIDLFEVRFSWSLLVVGVVISAVYGTLRAIITFGGYRVTRTSWGFRMCGGLVQRTKFEARSDEIVGVRINRNPLMQITGFCSFSLILATGRGDIKALPVLPVVRNSKAFQEVSMILPRVVRPDNRKSWGFGACVAGAGALVSGLLFLLTEMMWSAGLMLGASLWVGNVLVSRADIRDSWLTVESGLINQNLRMIHTEAVHTVSLLHRVIPSPARRSFMCVTVLDRRPKKLLVPGVRARVAEQIAAFQ